jgi:hypothetical protein
MIRNYIYVSCIDKSLYDKELLENLEEEFLKSNYWKVCKQCKIPYPANNSFFRSEKRMKDGLENKCKKCKGNKFSITGKRKHDSILYEIYNHDVSKLYENYLDTDVLPSWSFIKDNHIDIMKYLIENKYSMDDDTILHIDRNWMKSHKLYGLLTHTYKGRISDLIEKMYPNRFRAWDFITVGSTYWSKKENRIDALKWFVSKLIDDKVINNIDEIPKKITVNTFKEYKLGGLLVNYYSHPFYAIEEIYKDRFFEWEYVSVPGHYWSDKEKRIKALRQLIEYRLCLNIDNIPKVLSYEYFYYNKEYMKFRNIINEYYNFNLFQYINECYPTYFNKREFPYKNSYSTLDSNVFVKSEAERMIHHLLMKNKLKYTYESSAYKFYDNTSGASFRPDWIVEHDNKIIIVEYYGMLNMANLDYGYDEKYKMKDRYYKELCERDTSYRYIELVSEDIKDNMNGVIEKFEGIGIELTV